MSPAVLEEGSAPISDDLAEEFGILKGSEIEWERTGDGAPSVRATNKRLQAFDRFSEIVRASLRSGEDGFESFHKWREEEREPDPTDLPR